MAQILQFPAPAGKPALCQCELCRFNRALNDENLMITELAMILVSGGELPPLTPKGK